jgi:hypothetical protein
MIHYAFPTGLAAYKVTLAFKDLHIYPAVLIGIFAGDSLGETLRKNIVFTTTYEQQWHMRLLEIDVSI